MSVTWSKGAVPPRFGYFVEGQSNSRGRRRRRPHGVPHGWVDSLLGDEASELSYILDGQINIVCLIYKTTPTPHPQVANQPNRG